MLQETAIKICWHKNNSLKNMKTRGTAMKYTLFSHILSIYHQYSAYQFSRSCMDGYRYCFTNLNCKNCTAQN